MILRNHFKTHFKIPKIFFEIPKTKNPKTYNPNFQNPKFYNPNFQNPKNELPKNSKSQQFWDFDTFWDFEFLGLFCTVNLTSNKFLII